MADTAAFEEPRGGGPRQWMIYLLIVLLLLAVVVYLYRAFTAVTGVAVPENPPTAIDMLPPPPPPPPPPQPQEKPPEPTEAPTPTPEPAAPKPDAPAPMTQNAEAQAGTDSFGLAAGSGQGMGTPGGTGTCLGPNCGGGGGGIGDGIYKRYLSGVLQERIQSNDKVNRLVFTADFAISISGGQVTNVELLRSSGSGSRDDLLRSILLSARGLNPPPATMKFPQKITVRGRRAL